LYLVTDLFVLLQFSPKSGPVDGGTDVIIKGQNLGKNFSDIKNDILITRNMYRPHLESYSPASTIVCATDVSRTTRNGPVRIAVDTNHVGESADHFKFVVSLNCSIFQYLFIASIIYSESYH
jgi:hypothetical protein